MNALWILITIIIVVVAIYSYVYISDNSKAVNLPDNIIPIKQGFMTAYLIKIPSGFLLFDTGYEQDFTSFMKILEKYQINVNEIKYVFLSHHHDDHAGFVGKLTKINREMKLIVHKKAIPLLASGKNNTNNGGGIVNRLIYIIFKIKMFLKPDWTLTFPPFTIRDQDIIVYGEQIDIPTEVGLKGTIIHTPGHTTDGICLMLNEQYMLVGDQASNFLNWAGAKHLTLFNENVDEVYKSWEKIISMNIKFIVPSHGKPFRVERLKNNLYKYSQKDLVIFF